MPIEISNKIGDKLREICDLIIAHVSAEIQQRIQSGISEWDGEERQNSKAAQDLVQVCPLIKDMIIKNFIDQI